MSTRNITFCVVHLSQQDILLFYIPGALTIIIIPYVAVLAVIECASSLFLFSIGLGGNIIRASGDNTELSSRSHITCNLLSADWTFSPEKRPFFTLPVIFKDTDAVFSSASSFLNLKSPSLIYAVGGSGIGDSRLALLVDFFVRSYRAPAK